MRLRQNLLSSKLRKAAKQGLLALPLAVLHSSSSIPLKITMQKAPAIKTEAVCMVNHTQQMWNTLWLGIYELSHKLEELDIETT